MGSWGYFTLLIGVISPHLYLVGAHLVSPFVKTNQSPSILIQINYEMWKIILLDNNFLMAGTQKKCEDPPTNGRSERNIKPGKKTQWKVWNPVHPQKFEKQRQPKNTLKSLIGIRTDFFGCETKTIKNQRTF